MSTCKMFHCLSLAWFETRINNEMRLSELVSGFGEDGRSRSASPPDICPFTTVNGITSATSRTGPPPSLRSPKFHLPLFFGSDRFMTCCAAAKISWASSRSCTRTEDLAYCLLGLLGVNMPLIYGEGSKAFVRLQQELIKSSDDNSILAWRRDACKSNAISSLNFAKAFNIGARLNSGCLAPAPASFSGLQSVKRCVSRSRKEAYYLTNQGLSIELDLYRCRTAKDTYLAPLDCAFGSPLKRTSSRGFTPKQRIPSKVFTPNQRRSSKTNKRPESLGLYLQRNLNTSFFERKLWPPASLLGAGVASSDGPPACSNEFESLPCFGTLSLETWEPVGRKRILLSTESLPIRIPPSGFRGRIYFPMITFSPLNFEISFGKTNLIGSSPVFRNIEPQDELYDLKRRHLWCHNFFNFHGVHYFAKVTVKSSERSPVQLAVIFTPLQGPSVAIWGWQNYLSQALDRSVMQDLASHRISSAQMQIDEHRVVRATIGPSRRDPGDHSSVELVVLRLALESPGDHVTPVISSSLDRSPSFSRLKPPDLPSETYIVCDFSTKTRPNTTQGAYTYHNR